MFRQRQPLLPSSEWLLFAARWTTTPTNA